MIDTIELRRGNWIRTITGNYDQVVDVMCDSVNTLKGGGTMDDIYPIPLTPEILIKLKLPAIFEHDYNGVILNRPEYLHQLQNLYFALTGEELEIHL